MADSIITMFAFSADDPMQIIAKFADMIQWHNEHGGEWPTLPTPTPAPRFGKINGLARARSEPHAAPETLITELNDTAPPLVIVGPVQMWIYAPRLTVSE